MFKTGKQCWVLLRDKTENTFADVVGTLVSVLGLTPERAGWAALELDAFSEVDVFEGPADEAQRVADALDQRLRGVENWGALDDDDEEAGDDGPDKDPVDGTSGHRNRAAWAVEVGAPKHNPYAPFAGRVVAMDHLASLLLAESVAGQGAVVRVLQWAKGVARGYRPGGGLVRQGYAMWANWPDVVVNREGRLDAVVLADALDPDMSQPLVPDLPPIRDAEDGLGYNLDWDPEDVEIGALCIGAAGLARQGRGSLLVAAPPARRDGVPHAGQLIEHAISLSRPRLERAGATVKVVGVPPVDWYADNERDRRVARDALLDALRGCLTF